MRTHLRRVAGSVVLVVGLFLTLVPPCCAECAEPETTMPSCHVGDGPEVGSLPDCCLTMEAAPAGEVAEAVLAPQPALLPAPETVPPRQGLDPRPSRLAFEAPSPRGTPLLTLLCTLLI